MVLVAGIDSSTQSCKVVVRDADDGRLVRGGSAPHPDGTEVDPAAWQTALEEAAEAAGGLDDVAAVAVAGQQHGLVCLGADGSTLRPALLWNDTRSAAAAEALVAELGGGHAWADAVGIVPVASFTISKLRWLAEAEPDVAARTAAVCLPHDWLTWRLRGSAETAHLTTDRGDASGTGYWSAQQGYRLDLLRRAFGATPVLPRVLTPSEAAGTTARGALLAAGTGDNAAAALGLGAEPGDVVLSIGTSGVACAVSEAPVSDGSGTVAGFADATGRYLPLVCTLNGARVLDVTARLLGVDLRGLSELALAASPGADGLVLVPYLEGERTPNTPDAAGSLHGLTLTSGTPENLARAAVEGVLCGLADALDALTDQSVRVGRVLLIGGAARNEAVRRLAPAIFGRPVVVPEPSEYVADGAARQAAWCLSGRDLPPVWEPRYVETLEADSQPSVRDRYADAQQLVLPRSR